MPTSITVKGCTNCGCTTEWVERPEDERNKLPHVLKCAKCKAQIPWETANVALVK